MPPETKATEEEPKGNLPDPVMKVLEEINQKVKDLKPEDARMMATNARSIEVGMKVARRMRRSCKWTVTASSCVWGW